MKKLVCVAVVLLFVASTSVMAGNRDQNQRKRMRQGVRSGQLTRDEAQKLRQDRKAIREQQKAAREDGKVTREERAAIRKAKREQSRRIYQEKHDGETRPGATPPGQGIAPGEPHPGAPAQGATDASNGQ